MTILDDPTPRTSSRRGVNELLLPGVQRPRLEHRPGDVVSTALADESLELAAEFGLIVDEWQAYDLRLAMGIRADGSWAASEVGIDCPRQNGKGGVLEVRQLAGLYLLERRLQVHTAHVFDTAEEHFVRLRDLIENGPPEYERHTTIRVANGSQAIEVKMPGRPKCRLRFRARKGGGGRGLSGDDIYLDESMMIRGGVMASLRYALRGRENHQLWLTGSAPIGVPESDEWRTTIRQAERGDEPRLAFAGHSIDPAEAPGKDATDREVIRLAAVANPALGLRIAHETVLHEFRKARESSDPTAWQDWLRETLGVPDPDPYVNDRESKIPMAAWYLREDESSEVGDRLVLAVDVSTDREWSSIGVAGRRPDGVSWHGEVVEHAPKTSWVAKRCAEVVDRWGVEHPVVLDASGPAGSLVAELEELGLKVDKVTASGQAAACGLLFDLVTAAPDGEGFFHIGQNDLDFSVRKADVHSLPSGAWRWAPSDEIDVSPLRAVTFALGAAVGSSVDAPKPTFAF